MRSPGRISSAQLYALFFISAISTVFTTPESEARDFGAADRLGAFVPFLLLSGLCAVPLFYAIGKNGDRTLLSRARALSPGVEKTVAVLYAGGAFWSAALGAARLIVFLRDQVFTGESMLAFTVLFIAVCAYAALRGLETLSRAAVLFSAALLAGVALIFTASVSRFSWTELPVPVASSPATLLKSGVFALVKTPEVASLLLFAPRASGKLRRNHFIWLAAFAVLAHAVFLMCAGVTGKFGDGQEYRFYTLTAVARLRETERLDDILSALWILCAFIKTSFFLLLGAETLCAAFPIKRGMLLFSGTSATVVFLCVWICGAAPAYRAAADTRINAAVFALLVVLLPVAITAAEKRRKRRTGRGREAAV